MSNEPTAAESDDVANRPVALTADDDEFFRVALKTILMAQLGFAEVVETGSFDEALEKLAERSNIQLALLDLQMPGMTSAGSVRAVRECFPETRVIVVSASQHRDDIITALAAGAHGYVPKSMGVGDLAQAIETVLRARIYVPPILADLPTGPERGAEHIYSQAAAARREMMTLTPRQRQVLELLVQGKSNKEMARALKLAEGTVKVHLAALFRTMGVTSRSAAAAAGVRLLGDEEPRNQGRPPGRDTR